jgi:phage shock protein PspC (stress-responsive transcriptional regulator)
VRSHGQDIAAAAASVAVAVLLFTRFSLGDILQRDESIYAYAGQQMARGVPMYTSIFDPKTPLAGMVAGLAAGLARLLSVDDLTLIRLTFFVLAVATVLGMYLLGRVLWDSPVAGLVTATVFAAFRGFALDALTGPNAKTPGILAAVVAMVLLVRRQWFWAAFAGSVAFLVWQPLLVYAAVAVVSAGVAAESGKRVRTLAVTAAGAVIPVAVVALYFLVVGALGRLVVAGFVFPVVGLTRGQQTLEGRVRHITEVVASGFRHSGQLFWLGTALLVILLAWGLVGRRDSLRRRLGDPMISVVGVTFLLVLAFSVSDFQGYSDLYPLLPYAALGFGGTAAAVLAAVRNRPGVLRAATAAALVAVVALTVLAGLSFARERVRHGGLETQREDACALQLVLGGGGRLYALGNPTQLVLTHRRNPDRFVYLNSGVDKWRINHTTGGMAGWQREIQAARPTVIVQSTWHSRRARLMHQWLVATYDHAHIGRWQVFLAPGVRARAERAGVLLRGPNGTGPTAVANPAPGRC